MMHCVNFRRYLSSRRRTNKPHKNGSLRQWDCENGIFFQILFRWTIWSRIPWMVPMEKNIHAAIQDLFFAPKRLKSIFIIEKKKNDYANNYLQGKHFWSVHYPFEIMTKYCSLSGISQQKCSPNCTMNMFSVLFISYCLFYQTPWTQNEDTRKEHGADAHTKSKHVVNDNWSRSQANWCHSLGRAPLRNTLHELLQSVLNHAE